MGEFDYQKTLYRSKTEADVDDGSFTIDLPYDCMKDKLITVWFHPHSPDGMRGLEAGGEWFAVGPGTRSVDISRVSRPVTHIRLLFDEVRPFQGWYKEECGCCLSNFECPRSAVPRETQYDITSEFTRCKVAIPSVSGYFLESRAR